MTTRNGLHNVDTFVDEGCSFVERNQLDGQAASFGGLLWGMLRAVMECPECPGVFRVPINSPFGDDGEYIACPQCRQVWQRTPQSAAAPPAKEPV